MSRKMLYMAQSNKSFLSQVIVFYADSLLEIRETACLGKNQQTMGGHL